MAYPSPPTGNETSSQAAEWAMAYFNAGGASATVQVGQWGPFRRSDFQPGGDWYFLVPQGGSSGGGGAGGRGGAGAAQALAAVQANLPQLTGGGAGREAGVEQVSTALPARSDEWRGIDSLNPDTKLNPAYSPRAINWDGFRRIGSRSPRSGVVKLTDDIVSVRDSGAAALSSEYRGLSLLSMPGAADVGDQLMLCFSDKDVEIGGTPGGSSVATSYHVCNVGPTSGRPRNLNGMPGPSFALSKTGSGQITATYTYVGFSSTLAGLALQSIVAVSLRYAGPFSGATPRYPRDIDGEDGTGSVQSSLNRSAWTNCTSNSTLAISSLALGKYWFTMWALSRDGTSDPSFASFTLT